MLKGRSGSPLKRYQHRLSDGELRPDQSQLAAIGQLDTLYRALISGEEKTNWLDRVLKRRRTHCRGIYMWGGVGTGKSLLMDLFCRSLPVGLPKRVHFHRFMQSVHDDKSHFQGRRDPLADVAAQLAARYRVLCLDEFSVTDITDAMILSGLLHHLFSLGVTLVTTSNIQPDELYRGGLQRQRFLPAIELIKNQTRVVNVDGGNDYRMDYLKLDSLYHVPHNDKAVHALQQSFLHLEGDMGDAKDTVLLFGREVDIIAAGRGVVWFSFESLCKTSRSRLDYIELSKRFHTLLLSDIPLLDAGLDDPARRLIELVDELYDRGVNLIVSAAVLPSKLYNGNRLAEPFKRTISRLQEMGSQDYLARPHLL